MLSVRDLSCAYSYQLPKANEVLQRVFELIKPGGWLLIEDIIGRQRLDGDIVYGPGISIIFSSVIALASGRGAMTDIMLNAQSIIEQSQLFDTVNVAEVSVPYQPRDEDAKLKCLADAWRKNQEVVVRESLARFYEHEGFTRSIEEYGVAELRDSAQQLSTDFVFVSARMRPGRCSN